MANTYGTGTYDIVDGKLKIVDFYGQTLTTEYKLSGDELTIINFSSNTTYIKK